MHVYVYIVVDSGKCVSGKGRSILSANLIGQLTIDNCIDLY